MKTTDVLVIGGGPAGTAAALATVSSGATAVLLERTAYAVTRVGETLPPNAAPLLRRLGVWEAFVRDAHLPSPGNVSVWGDEAPYENDFLFNPYGHGWHLDRRRFDEALVHGAAKAGAEVLCEARPVDCTKGRGWWQVLVETCQRPIALRARRIVDATGRSSWLGIRQGAVRYAYDRLVGIAGLFECAADDPRTFVETRPTGWWYSAMLPGNRGIAVFFTDVDLHDLTPLGRKSLWNEQLRRSRQTKERLAGVRLDVDPHVVSASSTILSQVVGEGWLAVGDAACTIDPLSSQGIVWALTSGIEAAEALLDADPDAAAARYAARVNLRYRDYLRTRRMFYSRGRRWPDSTFWLRRSTDVVPPRRRGGPPRGHPA
jgi:flavin-dependent dehydrogenase